MASEGNISRTPKAARAPAEPIARLLSALSRLDVVLATHVAEFQATHATTPPDPYGGLYIAPAEVERLLGGASEAEATPAPLREPIALPAPESRLATLARRFELGADEADLLLIAAAPAVERRYERIYGFLQDDMTRRRATVDFALGLLYPALPERLMARRLLAPGAPLLRGGLLRLVDDQHEHQPSPLQRELRAEDRVVGYLLGDDELDPRLRPSTHLAEPGPGLHDLVLPDRLSVQLAGLVGGGTERQLVRLLTAKRGPGEGLVCYLQGAPGAGKATIARALCHDLGHEALLVVDAAHLPGDDAALAEALGLLRREAALQSALIYVAGVDTLPGDERSPGQAALLRELAGGAPLLLGGEGAWEPAGLPPGTTFVRVELPEPTAAERVGLWAVALAAEAPGVKIDDDALAALAGAFRLTPGQIRGAAARARGLALLRGAGGEGVTAADLAAACRLQASPRLAELARKVAPHFGWDDLVLPPERKAQLRELCAQVRHRARVHDGWGFGPRLALGGGLVALFAGQSGTGKTMAAGIIASELGLDLYKIDLATVVSKYIGETEKNLSRIFAEAERSNAVLFFDEADALFGKRSEVKDAHDRYANLEVAYLLQRVEEYAGVVILATNLRKNLDDAFVRRMQFIVEFPFPGEGERRRIWEGVWPTGAPREPGLDLGQLARRCELAGGNIRNAAVAAAFLAASNGGVVTIAHIGHAVRREYQKIGKVVGDGELV